jgi:hypothetical protein
MLAYEVKGKLQVVMCPTTLIQIISKFFLVYYLYKLTNGIENDIDY